MTKEELHSFLMSREYSHERDNEYHRDVFTKYIDGKKLEVFSDYYTVRILWWYERNRKTSTSAYLRKIDEGVLLLMIQAIINE